MHAFRSRKLIRADPSVANLHALSPHYYEVGHRLANMCVLGHAFLRCSISYVSFVTKVPNIPDPCYEFYLPSCFTLFVTLYILFRVDDEDLEDFLDRVWQHRSVDM